MDNSSFSGHDRAKTDAVLTEETTATKRQRQQQQQPPSLPSSSNPHGDSLHPPPLPFELVVEILCRLPVKSLLQFRCVCKSWNSLISDDPKFAKKHLRSSPKDFTRHHLIFGSTNAASHGRFTSSPLLSVFDAAVIAPSTQLDHPLNNPNPCDFIVGSCDGIVCLAIDGRFPLLWNPSTGRFKNLPALENPRPQDIYTVFGFGYDHFADCYKVVALFCHMQNLETQVKVHTVGTDSWRKIEEDFPVSCPFDYSGRFVSGTLNWFVDPNVIVSFDLGSECYQELLLPDHCPHDIPVTLGVLRDCLCVISFQASYSEIWLMQEYGNIESWTRLFYVWNECLFINAFHISENDEVLLELETLSKFESELIVYNFRDVRTSQIQNTMIKTPMVYVESLISPAALVLDV